MVTTRAQRKAWELRNPHYHRDYYRKNRERRKASVKKYRDKNKHTEKFKVMRRKAEKKNYDSGKKGKKWYRIRHKTRKKYGNLPAGYQYHHDPKDCRVDKFVVIHENTHKWFENR